jgi:hypothetical protein
LQIVVSTLTETLEQMKEQSKTKMIAAIEKMKELKGGYTAKSEEVNTANSRITELEEALSNASQEVLKYRGAMEKAMPKFKELKAELDSKTMEKNAVCEENTALTLKLQALYEKLEKNSDANNNLIDVSDSSDLNTSRAQINAAPHTPAAQTTALADFTGLTSTLTPVQASSTVDNLLDVDYDHAQEVLPTVQSDQIKNDEKETIANLAELVAQLKASKEEIESNAALTESSLRSEIEALTQVD